MSRVLVAGAAGMLGTDLSEVLERAGHDVTRADLPGLDILDPRQCHDHVAGHDVVVNCAAYTQVDAAEAAEDRAFAVNAVGAANLARAATAAGASVVQLSTDYVFDGRAGQPYDPDAPLAPRSAYGRTKAAGEWAVRAECPRTWVVRTAWLYGAHGPSFPATMARLAAERDTVEVVDDQRGQPTWTVDLAHGIERLLTAGAPYGVWHATGSGETTWFGLARAVFEELGLDPARVRPTTSEAYRRAAERPAYSVLSHRMWAEHGLDPLPDWRDALHRAAPSVLGG
jgi:dTDP-4-dehydrorhamnose reductase